MRRRDLYILAKTGVSDIKLQQLDADILSQLVEGCLITLSEAELDDAYQVGEARYQEAILQGRHDNHGFAGTNGLDLHQVGAAGEFAAAKALDVPWERTINTFKLPDLGTNIQVKTRPRAGSDLQVRPNANDDEIFVHVCRCSRLTFCVHGWLYGRDAKRVEAYDRPDRTQLVFYTPIVDLDTIQSLREKLHQA